MKPSGSVSDFYYIKLCLMSYFFLISLADLFYKTIYRIIFHNADGTSPKSAASDPGAQYARHRLCRSTRMSISSQDTS